MSEETRSPARRSPDPISFTDDVLLDPDSANPNLLLSSDEKRLRCGLERRDVSPCPQRFDGWWCAVGREGYASGRHYWEVEVGERDWRLGVVKASAVRQGFRPLNAETGYLTLRLERGSDLKALTVPPTLLPKHLAPRKVGVYLDYEEGQLSFYDVEKLVGHLPGDRRRPRHAPLHHPAGDLTRHHGARLRVPRGHHHAICGIGSFSQRVRQ
uniref:Zgc:194990 n=1 Tax=Oryzias melastigma TaxID=30732 RepID=A0A3B3DBM5_ORYME